MGIFVGDTHYFSAQATSSNHELWAHDTSNSSTWKAVHTNPAGNSNPSGLILVGDTLYFGASDISAHKFWAHQPGEITSLSSGSGNGASSSSAFAYANNKLDANRATHTCAITENGDLKCWGWDNKGQLGDGGTNTDTNAPSSTAIDLGTGRTALQVVTGLQHTCAILDNGDMKCWGHDWKGQLGDGGPAWSSANPTANDLNAPSSTPINLGSGRTAVAASAGDYHTCAILDNGDLKCWGIDSAHGYGATNTDILAPLSTPIDLGMGRTAIAVSAGSGHTCAILDNGDLKCWGADNYGQLGNGGSNIAINAPSSPPIDLGLGRTAVAVSAGTYHTCAILDNGDAKCWGRQDVGQLGQGSASSVGQTTPVLVAGSNTWDSSTIASSGSSGGMTNVTGATCSVSPALPTGLSMDSSTCTISGTPSVATSNTTYTVTANISGTTYQGTVWLATMTFGTIISPVMGAELDLGEAMTPITLNYTSQAGDATVYNGNGTAWMVKDIFAGQAAYYQGSYPQYLTAVGDTLFFNAKGAYPYGYELWKSDGTEAGTVMVKEIEPGYNQYNGGARYLTAAGDTLYFTADDGIHGLELWKSDGTEAGTVMVKDLWPGNDSSGSPNDGFKHGMTAIGDIVYFSGNDGVNGYGLYKSDGTANGTEFISSPFTTHPSPSMYDLVAAGDTLYFHATSTGQTADMALYKSDGTANGTVMLKNIACGGWTCRLTPVGDKLFFSNDDGVHGQELWVSDGTVNGTVMVKDIAPIGGSNPFHTGTSGTPGPAVIGDTVFFKAYINGSYPYEWALWKSDGTEAGTVLVSNKCCLAGSAPIVYGDSIFFPSDDAAGGIWRSDGTSSGTVLETNSVTLVSNAANEITGMGNTLYFSYANPDPELWAYNPTNLTLNTPPPVSWETHPELPEGMSISNGVISGTPSVYAVNQTYTIYANQSGETTTFDMYFSVDTNNPHTVVENQPIDAIGFHGPFQNGTTNWTVSPALPADLVMDPNTGEITGSVNGVLANTTYTVNATHSDGATETFTFSLQSLADFDGDELPNDLPSDYDAAQGPTPGLVADTDDDADGFEDVIETDTGVYVDGSDTGTDPLDPDTDDDGICDGPISVWPICVAGPDSNAFGTHNVGNIVLVENIVIEAPISPPNHVDNAIWEVAHQMPTGLNLNSSI